MHTVLAHQYYAFLQGSCCRRSGLRALDPQHNVGRQRQLCCIIQQSIARRHFSAHWAVCQQCSRRMHHPLPESICSAHSPHRIHTQVRHRGLRFRLDTLGRLSHLRSISHQQDKAHKQFCLRSESSQRHTHCIFRQSKLRWVHKEHTCLVANNRYRLYIQVPFQSHKICIRSHYRMH